MRFYFITYIFILGLILSGSTVSALSLKDFFSVEKLKILNYLDVTKTPSEGGWLRSVTVKIPAQLDIAGLATSQIPFLDVNSNKDAQVTFVTWFATEKEADNLLSFVDYLNKIPYKSEQIMDNFAIGEEIRFKTKLSFLTGVSAVPKLLITPMALKGNTILTGEFAVYIKKISEKEIEISYTNVNDQEKGINGNIGTNTNLKVINVDSSLNVSLKKWFPRLVDFSNSDSSTYARTQSFVVDLSSEKGQEFYNKLLGSAVLTEELKSLLEKRSYSLEQIKSLFVDPYTSANDGVTPKEFGSIKSSEYKQKFSLGWLFKNSNTQQYRRLWYQHQNQQQQESYYLVDEFEITKGKNNLLGFGTVLNEKRVAKAFYQSDEKGTPQRFIELQLNNSLNLTTKDSIKHITNWEKRLKNNFPEVTEISELMDFLKIASEEKETLKTEVKFTLKEQFFRFLNEKYHQNKSRNQSLREIIQHINSHLDKLPRLSILTLNSCIGKVCDFFSSKNKSNSQLYAAEVESLALSIYQITKSKTTLKEKSNELAELRKNPLFSAMPIGILTGLLDKESFENLVNFEIIANNEKTKETKKIQFGQNKKALSQSLLETIQFLQGEILNTRPLNKCLLYY